jgi:catechol 2,3-dioxygenase-like lactoylglutathione lyase family enzyme
MTAEEQERMKPKLSMITLGVRDYEKSIAFYREGLGFPAPGYKESEGTIFFHLEGVVLALYPRDKLAEDATVPDTPSTGFNGITLAHNVKSKEEADRVWAHAVSIGAKPVKKPQDVFWGGYSGYFADPDGYLWEVAWNPFIDLT